MTSLFRYTHFHILLTWTSFRMLWKCEKSFVLHYFCRKIGIEKLWHKLPHNKFINKKWHLFVKENQFHGKNLTLELILHKNLNSSLIFYVKSTVSKTRSQFSNFFRQNKSNEWKSKQNCLTWYVFLCNIKVGTTLQNTLGTKSTFSNVQKFQNSPSIW